MFHLHPLCAALNNDFKHDDFSLGGLPLLHVIACYTDVCGTHFGVLILHDYGDVQKH